MEQTDYSYIGVGPIFLRKRSGTGGLIPIGNASALNFAVEEDVKALPDHTEAGGGTRNEVRRIKSVGIKVKVHDLSPDNISLAVYGDSTAVAAGTVTDEAITAKLGALVPLSHTAPSSAVVQDETDTTTYVEGTDYEVRSSGLWFPGDSNISDDQLLHVDFTYPGQDVVEALTQSAEEYEMLFEGLNEARSGKAAVVRSHRNKFGPTKSLDLIGDDFAGLELEGTVLSDSSQPVGLSRFFKATLEQ